MSDDNNDDVIDISGYGAAQPVMNVSYGSGTDTITLDPSIYSAIGSLTVPTTSITAGTGLYSTTIPSGGYTLSASGAGTGHTWTTTNNWNSSPKVKIDSDGLTMEEGTDIRVGGRSLNKVLEALEDKLAILYPNEELESKWDELREARRKYVELEKELLEKEKMWKILKEK